MKLTLNQHVLHRASGQLGRVVFAGDRFGILLADSGARFTVSRNECVGSESIESPTKPNHWLRSRVHEYFVRGGQS